MTSKKIKYKFLRHSITYFLTFKKEKQQLEKWKMTDKNKNNFLHKYLNSVKRKRSHPIEKCVEPSRIPSNVEKVDSDWLTK